MFMRKKIGAESGRIFRLKIGTAGRGTIGRLKRQWGRAGLGKSSICMSKKVTCFIPRYHNHLNLSK